MKGNKLKFGLLVVSLYLLELYVATQSSENSDIANSHS